MGKIKAYLHRLCGNLFFKGFGKCHNCLYWVYNKDHFTGPAYFCVNIKSKKYRHIVYSEGCDVYVEV